MSNMQWNEQKIAELSPNKSTLRRSHSVASTQKWANLCTDYQLIWGEYKGSAANHYQVQVHLKDNSFACNCPVRTKPCKHILGMLQLYVKSSANFKFSAPAEWLKAMPQTAAIQHKKEKKAPQKSAKAIEKANKAKQRRWQKRLELMASGINDLEQWLNDIVRQGLANMDAQAASFWETMAAKMVDAKMPRLSSYLKETHHIILRQDEWSEMVTARLAELYFMVESFRKQQQLSSAQQEALFTALGKTTRKSDIIEKNPTIRDQWIILAVIEDEDIEGRPYRKVWMQGQQHKQFALILDFSFGNVGYDQHFSSGTTISADLVYYSSLRPQRAVCLQQEIIPEVGHFALEAFTDFSSLLEEYTQSLQQNPWQTTVPALIENLAPVFDNDSQSISLIDQNNHQIPIPPIQEDKYWQLLATSGGHPITIFGEWDGHFFTPLSLVDDLQRLLPLT